MTFESILIEKKEVVFKIFPVLYKGQKGLLASQTEKSGLLSFDEIEEVKNKLLKKYWFVSTNGASQGIGINYETIETRIYLDGKSPIHEKWKDNHELNLYDAISQFDYELIARHKQDPDFIEINMDNNYVWGKIDKHTMLVHGLIINRPRTLAETIIKIRSEKIRELVFVWNNNNPYIKLFKNTSSCKLSSKCLFANKDFENNNIRMNLIYTEINHK